MNRLQILERIQGERQTPTSDELADFLLTRKGHNAFRLGRETFPLDECPFRNIQGRFSLRRYAWYKGWHHSQWFAKNRTIDKMMV